MLPRSCLQSSIRRHELLQQKNLITRIAKKRPITNVSGVTNKYIYSNYYCLEDDQKQYYHIYIYIDHCWIKGTNNISIMITTVLKMTKSSSIIHIYIIVVWGVTNKYIYDDSTIIKITKVVLSYISIINVSGATNKYI